MTLATEITRGTRRAMNAGSADLARVRSRLDKGLRHARRDASRRVAATDRYVHQHPWVAMAVMAGAAAITGMLVARLITRDR